MKRNAPRRRRPKAPRGQKAFLKVLKEGGVAPQTNLLGRGLEQAAMKDLYVSGRDGRAPTPWNSLPADERAKAQAEFARLHRIIENRSLRVEDAVPRELALIGDAHRHDADPEDHAPIPTVPDGEMDLLSDQQESILRGLTLYTAFRRFLRKARRGVWRDLEFKDLARTVSECSGLELHLFRRVDDDTFVASFRMDATGRYYAALAFRPSREADQVRDKLLGRGEPYAVYFFTCTCQ